MNWIEVFFFLLVFGAALSLLGYVGWIIWRDRRDNPADPMASAHGDVPHIHHGENFR